MNFYRSSLETRVIWRKDSLILEKGKRISVGKNNSEPKVLVDAFYTINLVGITIFHFYFNFPCTLFMN